MNDEIIKHFNNYNNNHYWLNIKSIYNNEFNWKIINASARKCKRKVSQSVRAKSDQDKSVEAEKYLRRGLLNQSSQKGEGRESRVGWVGGEMQLAN